MLLSYLRHLVSERSAILLNGTIFGLVHVQYWQHGGLAVALFVVAALGLVATISALWEGTIGQQLTAATMVHLGANLATTAATSDGVMAQVGLAIGCWLGCGLVVTTKRVMRRWTAA